MTLHSLQLSFLQMKWIYSTKMTDPYCQSDFPQVMEVIKRVLGADEWHKLPGPAWPLHPRADHYKAGKGWLLMSLQTFTFKSPSLEIRACFVLSLSAVIQPDCQLGLFGPVLAFRCWWHGAAGKTRLTIAQKDGGEAVALISSSFVSDVLVQLLSWACPLRPLLSPPPCHLAN